MSFSKRDIVDLLNFIPMLKDHGVLLHGASMVLQGVKPFTNDIDIYVPAEIRAKIDIWLNPTTFDFGEESSLDANRKVSYIEVDGIKCQTLKSVIEEKRVFARPKDLEAIELIQMFLTK